MKKVFLGLLLMFTAYGASMAQTLVVEDVEVLPGTTGKYALEINVGGGEYTGFQYDIQFPSTGFSTPTTGKSTVNASWSGGSIIPGDLTAGKGRLSALSMSNDLIPTGDIKIGTVSFDVANDVSLGEYDVTISNFEFLSGTTRTPVSDVTFKVKVVNAFTVILDETSTTSPVNATGVNVIVKRTIKANEWSTICLPFAMSEAQTKAAFGDDVELADFTGYGTQEEGDAVIGITINFQDVTAIEANHPYIIKVSNKVTEFTVNGVDVAPEEEPMVEIGKSTRKAWKIFRGTYVAETMLPYDPEDEIALFLSGNKVWYASSSTKKMKGYRAYFSFSDILADVENASARIGMVFDESGTTGISTIGVDTNEGKYYNLQGMPVEKPSRGLYIGNGRKIIIK